MNPTVDFAAEELKKYLRMMMPRSGEIPITCETSAQDSFRLALMADIGMDMSDAEDSTVDDIVYIDTDSHGGIIAGSNPGALLIAVYRYLRFCGCRWLFPGVDGEWIPIIETLPRVKYRKLADHRYRGQCNEGAEYQPNMIESIDFSPKIGLNTYMLEFDNPYVYYSFYYNHVHNTVCDPEPVDPDTVLQWKRQCETEIKKRGLRYHDMGHGWTAEPFGISSTGGWSAEGEDNVPSESRPYLAMINGKRGLYGGVPLNTNICLSNPEARSIMAKYIADYAQVQNNVDYLHIWQADNHNNHCECDECRKRDISDWYVILLNDIDAELTKRHLDTHLVFIVYYDTFWPPLKERLNNKKRYSMLYAPITRLYTETYEEEPDLSKIVPYHRNHNLLPKGMAESLGYLKKWKEVWDGDCFCYEYHFWRHQYFDPSGLYLAQLLHHDIAGLRKHGLHGIVEDGSQRSFFPNGFAFYLYGETLFDADVKFEDLLEDYFTHAYGFDWQLVVDFLTRIHDRIDYAYLAGLKSADGEKGPYYAPEYVRKAKEIPSIVSAFKPIVERNLHQKKRSSAVSWQILKYDLEYLNGLADIVISLCVGDYELARMAKDRLKDKFSKYEVFIQRHYDHFLAGSVMEELVRDPEICVMP